MVMLWSPPRCCCDPSHGIVVIPLTVMLSPPSQYCCDPPHCITTVLLGRCARASCVPCPTILCHKSVVGQVRAGFLRSLPNITVLQQFCWAGARGLPAFPAQQYCITRVWLGRCARVSCVPCPTTLYHKSFVGQVRAGFLRSLPNNTVSEEFCWGGARGLPAFPARQHCITRVVLARCARASCVPCPTHPWNRFPSRYCCDPPHGVVVTPITVLW